MFHQGAILSERIIANALIEGRIDPEMSASVLESVKRFPLTACLASKLCEARHTDGTPEL